MMRTVKEISTITGISVRTLHYYDEIGLLRPTEKSEAGYRLYDDKALETLQQILFFREFDMPLKEIRSILDSPTLDRNQILQMQRNMLMAKKERLERLIASIDDILKGDNKMDFEVFGKSELEEMYQGMTEKMTEDYKARIIEKFGSMEEYRKQFLQSASTEQAQKNFQKIVEWYGNKDEAMDAMKHPFNQQVFSAYQNRIEAVMKKLAAKKGCDVNSFEVKEIVGEYDFVSRQLFQIKDMSKMMLDMADSYRTNPEIQRAQDRVFGEGASEFIGKALEAFYRKSDIAE